MFCCNYFKWELFIIIKTRKFLQYSRTNLDVFRDYSLMNFNTVQKRIIEEQHNDFFVK